MIQSYPFTCILDTKKVPSNRDKVAFTGDIKNYKIHLHSDYPRSFTSATVESSNLGKNSNEVKKYSLFLESPTVSDLGLK